MTRKLLTLALYFSCLWASARPDLTSSVDWEKFLAKQDLVWDSLPGEWYDAAFMGNGTLGSMVYKPASQNVLRFDFCNAKIHDQRMEGNMLFRKPRLLSGHFELQPIGKVLSGTMRLSIWNAATDIHLNTTKGKITLRSWVHADSMVMVVQAHATGEEQNFHWTWKSERGESPRYLYMKEHQGWGGLPANYPCNPLPEQKTTQYGGVAWQRYWVGGMSAVCWEETQIVKNEESERIFYANISPSGMGESTGLSLANQEDAIVKSKRIVANAKSKSFESLWKSHVRWWHRYYPKSYVSLPDAQMEKFYWLQLYKLASATRENRCLIDCTGPWLTITPWPNAWWNLNVQLSYWPLNASNHLDLAGSLEHALYDHVDNLRNNLATSYRKGALGLGRFSDMECHSDRVGVPGVDKDAEIGLLTWACHNLWLINRYKVDDDVLEKQLYPLLKGAVNYYLYFLYRGEDGKCHLPATYSPEYGSAEDCNFDLALLTWGCQTLLQITERLGIEDGLQGKWKDVLDNLVAFPTDSTGLMIGRNVPYRYSHRHYSHLLSIYPLYLLNREQSSETVKLIEKSLQTWQDKKGAHQGYSLTGASSISAALGKGDDALRYLQSFFNHYLSSTTMYREAGPVLESPLSGAQCILDILLQSWGGKVRVFPAIPSQWKDVEFRKLRAEGGFEVSAMRSGGKTVSIAVKSLVGEPLVLETDMNLSSKSVQISPKSMKKGAIRKIAPHIYQIDLPKGKEIRLGESIP